MLWIEHRAPCLAAADLAILRLGLCRKENPTLYRTNPYRGNVHPYGRAASFAKDTKNRCAGAGFFERESRAACRQDRCAGAGVFERESRAACRFSSLYEQFIRIL